MQIVTRQEAKSLGVVRYFTGQPCKYGHISERHTSDGICYSCQKRRANRRNKQLRNKVVTYLGGRCSICQFSDFRALQIDHVNGGGSVERQTLKDSKFYQKVLTDTSGLYQLLCANCNWIKRHENEEYGNDSKSQ